MTYDDENLPLIENYYITPKLFIREETKTCIRLIAECIRI